MGFYTIIRFQGINFRGCSEILENSEIYCPQKFSTIRYLFVYGINMHITRIGFISEELRVLAQKVKYYLKKKSMFIAIACDFIRF